MSRRTTVLLTAVVLAVTGLAAPLAAPIEVEITDLKPTQVEYPKGPTIIVRNRAKSGGVQAWVIRHLDGVVVNRYELPATERWQEQLNIAPKGVSLPRPGTAGTTTVPFAVLIVLASGEVKASAPFEARVSPPKPWWPTIGAKPDSLITGGVIADVRKPYLTVKDSEGASKTYQVTEHTMTSGGAWGASDWKPSKGDSVAMIYTDEGGQGIATTIAHRPAGELLNPWTPGSAYVGTVKSPPLMVAGRPGFVIETEKYDGRWHVDESTEKVFLPPVTWMKELRPGALVGLRVKAGPPTPPKAPVPVDRFFVLTPPPSGG